MTEVAYIHGIGMTSEEMKQRGANVPAPRLVDYSRMSDGELSLFLLREQTDILKSYYPEVKTYEAAFNIITDSLAAGIHGANGIGAPSGVVEKTLNPVFQAIRKAKKRTGPAGRFMVNDLRANVGNPLVPILDCEKLYEIKPKSLFDQAGGFGTGLTYTQYQSSQLDKRALCDAENNWRRLLNDHMEKISHHPLYEFMTNSQAKQLNALSEGKPLLHKLGISNIGGLSKIHRTNIRMWQQNGIMRRNVVEGGKPINGFKSINELITKAKQEAGVGEIATVLAILAAITAAITAAGKFVVALKLKQPTAAQQFQNSVQGWGSYGYGGGYEDFEVNDDGSSSGGSNDILSENNLPLFLAAGAGLLLMTSK